MSALATIAALWACREEPHPALGEGEPSPEIPFDADLSFVDILRPSKPPADPMNIRFTSLPIALGEPSQHHAVVALSGDGIALVAWYGDRTTDAVRIETDTMLVEPLPLSSDDIFANHPTLEKGESGWLAAATVESGGLAGRAIAADGHTLGDPVTLSSEISLYPDLSSSEGLGMLVWTDTVALQCRVFAGAFAALQPIPCPDLIEPGLKIGTPVVRLSGDELWYAWTERDPITTAFHVAVATVVDGAFSTTLVSTEPYGGELSGRVQLAADAGSRLLAWRGAAGPGDPVRSFLQPLGEEGAPTGAPFALGVAPGLLSVERPTIAAVGGLALVAWEEAGQLWMEVRSPSGEPLSLPVAAATDLGREPRRPALDLIERPDGWLSGIMSWESAPPGSDTETFDRFVVVRTFEIER